MVHSGYLSNNAGISGFPFGIGGAAKFHFNNHFRIGIEGYSSNLSFNGDGSYWHVGWGGLLVDWIWQTGKISPFVGTTVGGGGYKSVDVIDSPFNLTFPNAAFKKESFMAIIPYVGIEYAVTHFMRINVKVDYLFNMNKSISDFVSGPRIYFGFAFYRLKS